MLTLIKHINIISWNRYSKGARFLARQLGIKYRTKNFNNTQTLINWGCSRFPIELPNDIQIINLPQLVLQNSNKLLFFNKMDKYCSLPPWTIEEKDAENWIKNGKMVFARTLLSSHSGNGIIICKDKLTPARLYTQYIKKSHEYRIHFAFGKRIDIQQKILPSQNKTEETNFYIRNHKGGFIYIRNEINPPEDVIFQAESCFQNSGLHFGAVDVIYNSLQKKAYVLEINTAPGLEGTSVSNYATAFKENLQ
jgi:hypothetical protein